MKKYFPNFVFLLAIMNFSICSYAQVDKKSSFSIGIGRPTHPDMDINEKGFLLSLNYKQNLTRFFNWGAFLHRATANSELDFFDDNQKLLNYLNSSELPIGIATDFSKVETYAFGIRLHFPFVNNNNHFFSFSASGGYYTSKSRSQSIVEVTERFFFDDNGDVIDSEFIEVVGEINTATKTEPFIMPALEYHYKFKNKYTLGIEANFLLDQDSQSLTTHPVLANYYSFNLQIGRKF